MRYSVLIACVCLQGCVMVTDGIELQVAYQAPGTPIGLSTDMGYRVSLDEAYIAFESLALVTCPSELKHTATTPTKMGAPVVIDLVKNTGAPIGVGTLRPAPGQYCGVRLSVARADGDAVGMPEGKDTIAGVVIEGLATRAQTQAPVTLAVESLNVRELSFAEPLELGSDALDAAVVVRVDHLRWFDGIAFEDDAQHVVRTSVLDNVEASFEVSVLK